MVNLEQKDVFSGFPHPMVFGLSARDASKNMCFG